MLDTCVYIDVLQNRTSKGVDGLLASRVCHHSSVCLSELTHAFGRLDPKHPGTASALDNIRQTIQKMPPQRLHVPDASAWGQAGMVAGELARRSGLQSRHMGESKYLKDALIACQARMIGASVLTANIQDFDFISQILKGVQVLFYRWPEVVALRDRRGC